MGLIGHEIVQSRTWIDPNATAPPNLNYKLTFPITVFDAVRRDMQNEDSETLAQVLDNIRQIINSKQSLIPAKPANYLVTYGGVAGAVGSIQISNEIPWNSDDQSNTRIPTEKAVGDLIMKLGIDPDNPDDTRKVRWSDVIGRPNIYNKLGVDENGLINQKVITNEINAINKKIDTNNEGYINQLDSLKSKVDNHNLDINNPHHITLSQIGAASADSLNEHLVAENPHNINKLLLGLENVDNTKDLDKPISLAAQEEFKVLHNLIENMTDDVGELNFIVNIDYIKDTGEWRLIYRNGTTIKIDSPIEETIKSLNYDPNTKELVMVNTAGIESRTNLSDLFIRYNGYVGNNITVEIEGNQVTGTQIIKAYINQKSIKSTDIADNAIVGRTIKDQAISGAKIQDLTLSTIKYADRSITSKKIATLNINNEHILDRAIDGRTLFSSTDNFRVLTTINANTNPVWSLITSNMIDYDSILSKHIMKHAVTYDKIADRAVGTEKIEDLSITTDKIINKSITTEKIQDRSITSDILAENLMFEGSPKIRNTPSDDSDNNLLVDTRWVRKFAKDSLIVNTSNIAKRAVTADKLFSSQVRNRVLAVLKANQDPEWTIINNEMMGEASVDTINIIDNSITADKLDDKSIEVRHLTKDIIGTKHINESAITSEKIYKSHEANRVLAALSEDGHPTYSQVTEQMMAPNSVGNKQLIDGTINASKLESSTESQQVMAVGLKGSLPQWSKIMTGMISDRAVDGSKLFTSEKDHVVLGLTRANLNPTWIKLVGDMIAERTIKSINISEKTIKGEVIDDSTIESRNIMEDAILRKHVKDGEITPAKLETSPYAGRVMAVSGLPYSTPMWSQINTLMIEDKAVTKEKLFQSEYPYHVLAATQAGVPPEYTMISHEFIVDGTIIPEKLKRDFVLLGTPELTVQPPEKSNDYCLANTRWVRNTIDSKIIEFLTSGEVPSWFPKFDFNDIPEHGIDGSKLFTHPYGPRVLGITAPNDDVEFILIEEDLIVDGAVTSNKLQRSIHLFGSPVVEVRPSPNASDADGNGHHIPDCQWVLDRIKDSINGSIPGGSGGSGSSTTNAVIPHGSVTTLHLQDRAVDSSKLFSSSRANRLIGVLDSNSSPIYLQANNDMIGDRAINGRTLFSSDVSERIIGVHESGTDPIWTQVTSGMIADKAVQDHNIADRTISESKYETGSVSMRALANEPIVDEARIYDHAVSKEKIRDSAVTTEKLIDGAVTTNKIHNKSVSGDKLSDDLILPRDSKTKSSRNYEQKSIRNITLSPNNPRGGRNGDIWFKFS